MVRVLPIGESVSHAAATLIENLALSHGMQVADAIIAARARDTGHTLITGNARQFRAVPGLDVRAFRPTRTE